MVSPAFNPSGSRSGWPQSAAAAGDPGLQAAVARATAPVGAIKVIGAMEANAPSRRRGLPWPELCGPWLLGLAVLAAMAVTGADFRWADWLYALQGHAWGLKSAFVTETLVHKLGRDLSTLAWLGVVAAWWRARRRPTLDAARQPLAVLALSVLLATGLVAWIKSWSNMDCPWDLLQYGGHRPFVGLWQARPESLAHNRCFPAGHASAGYAWMALYFYFLAVRPAWRWLGLATGVLLGLLFGLSQQLRGAHFASHDVWAALLCWSVAAVAWRVAGGHGAGHGAGHGGVAQHRANAHRASQHGAAA